VSTVRLALPLVEGGRDDGAPALPLDRADRNLLVRGNTKLGEDVCHFDLPAVETCPGRSRACSGVVRTGRRSKGSRRCYVLKMYAYRPALRACHGRNREALGDLRAFARRVLGEVRRRRIRTIRWHVSGDVFSVRYARTLLFLMASTPDVEHFLYTRSWRVARLRPWMERMAQLPNVSVWYSVDRSTGLPDARPRRVRLAWMALSEAEQEPWACADQIARCDLVFLDAPLRRPELATFAGVRVCPQERDHRVTCTSCRYCMPERLNRDLGDQ
jgi:hypothetical protein